MSWRRFVGLGLQDKVPDETALVRFRQRLLQYGGQEKLLTLVNRQLEQKGFILKTCALVDATLPQAARRAPAQDNKTSGDDDAGFTVKGGQPHYGYKAHVAVDREHTLNWNWLTVKSFVLEIFFGRGRFGHTIYKTARR